MCNHVLSNAHTDLDPFAIDYISLCTFFFPSGNDFFSFSDQLSVYRHHRKSVFAHKRNVAAVEFGN